MRCRQMDGEEQKCTNVISQSRRSGNGGGGSRFPRTGKGSLGLGGGRNGRIWCKRIVGSRGLLYIELWAVMLLFKIHQNILMLNAYVQYSKYIASNY